MYKDICLRNLNASRNSTYEYLKQCWSKENEASRARSEVYARYEPIWKRRATLMEALEAAKKKAKMDDPKRKELYEKFREAIAEAYRLKAEADVAFANAKDAYEAGEHDDAKMYSSEGHEDMRQAEEWFSAAAMYKEAMESLPVNTNGIIKLQAECAKIDEEFRPIASEYAKVKAAHEEAKKESRVAAGFSALAEDNYQEYYRKLYRANRLQDEPDFAKIRIRIVDLKGYRRRVPGGEAKSREWSHLYYGYDYRGEKVTFCIGQGDKKEQILIADGWITREQFDARHDHLGRNNNYGKQQIKGFNFRRIEDAKAAMGHPNPGAYSG